MLVKWRRVERREIATGCIVKRVKQIACQLDDEMALFYAGVAITMCIT